MAASDIMIATNSYASVEASLLGLLSINFVPGFKTIGKDFCSEFNKNCLIVKYDIEDLCSYLITINNSELNYKTKLKTVQKSITGIKDRKTVEEVINKYVEI